MENEIVLFAYPNPTHEILNVKISRLHEMAQSELYDNSGRQLISTGEWKGESTIDMSGLSKGMYILKVKTVGGVVVNKIVKDE